MKKSISPRKKSSQQLLIVGMIIFLLIGLIVGVWYSNTNKRLGVEALGDTAKFLLSPSTVSANQNDSFQLGVSLGTPDQAIVGADVVVLFDATKLLLESITPITTTSLKTFAPNVSGQNSLDTAKVVNLANSTGIVEFGVVTFDHTANSGAGGITPPYTGSTTLAQLQFKVKSGASGQTTISVKYDGASATTDANVLAIAASGGTPEDILAAPTSSTTVSIISPTTPVPTSQPSLTPTTRPTPTPTTGGGGGTDDLTLPKLTIINPTNGEQLKKAGRETIEVTATDASGIDVIRIYVDDSFLSECTNTQTCKAGWQLNSVSSGSHTIRAEATDKSPMKNKATQTILITKP